jgi:NAD(P)-dependent dehydrogenase (short-subunit alcohol dehydrogenase family)
MKTIQNKNGSRSKVAVITGSSEGIGKAIVMAFANCGEYSGIVTNSKKIDAAQQVSDEIKTLGCDSIAIQADVSLQSFPAREMICYLLSMGT